VRAPLASARPGKMARKGGVSHRIAEVAPTREYPPEKTSGWEGTQVPTYGRGETETRAECHKSGPVVICSVKERKKGGVLKKETHCPPLPKRHRDTHNLSR